MKSYCIGFTLQGKSCGNKTQDGLYCYLHKSSSKLGENNIEIDISKLDISKFNVSNYTFPVMRSPPVNTIDILDTCSICLENVYPDTSAKLKCGHHYHFKCIVELRSPVCPSCRKNLESPLINNNLINIMLKRRHEDDKTNNRVSIQDYLQSENDEMIENGVTPNSAQSFMMTDYHLALLEYLGFDMDELFSDNRVAIQAFYILQYLYS